jgi:hypothetical protein
VGFGIDRRARSRKTRGLFRRPPEPREVADRLGRLVKRMERDAVRKATWKQDRFVVELRFHRAARAATLTLGPDGELAVRAETVGIGPGYHAEILARLAPIFDELDYVWADDEPEPAGAMCAWLAAELGRDGPHRFGLPSDLSFFCDAPVLTALGPRDAAWRSAVIADPRRAADAFAWWQRGAGHAERARALLAMWLEVPWREPLDDDEHTLMKRVDEDLRAAQAADGKLALPYAAWAELLGYLSIDNEHAATVRAAAVQARANSDDAPVGYRRYDMEIELTGGWTVRVPGSFAGSLDEDGARYWATDGNRVIEFTSLTAEAEVDSAKLLAVAPERHPVLDRFVDGSRHGRAEVCDEDGVHTIYGLVSSAPHVAILTCKAPAKDEPWALATWRSLRRA